MKRFLIGLICTTFLFGIFGCKAKEASIENNGSNLSHVYMGNTLIEDDDALTYSIINPYETQLQLSTMQIWGYLGKAELNQDAAFVKSGKGSLKVQVESKPMVYEAPCIYQALNQTPINGKAHNDFTEVTHICVDVYSAETETTRLGVGLVYFWNSNDRNNTSQSATTWIDVQPGWNKIVYTVNRESIIQTDILTEDGITVRVPYVQYVSFWFERGEADKVYYFDNLKLYKTGTPTTVIDDVREKDEICTFEQSWQVTSLQHFPWLSTDLCPTLELNTDLRYVKNNRGGSLKMVFPIADAERYSGVNITDAYLDKMDFTQYRDDDYLCFNFYTPVENPVDFAVVQLFTNSNENIFFSRDYPIVAGKWMTVRLPIGELRNGPTPQTNINNCQIMQVASYTKSTIGILYVDNICVETAH